MAKAYPKEEFLRDWGHTVAPELLPQLWQTGKDAPVAVQEVFGRRRNLPDFDKGIGKSRATLWVQDDEGEWVEAMLIDTVDTKNVAFYDPPTSMLAGPGRMPSKQTVKQTPSLIIKGTVPDIMWARQGPGAAGVIQMVFEAGGDEHFEWCVRNGDGTVVLIKAWCNECTQELDTTFGRTNVTLELVAMEEPRVMAA